MIFHSLTFPRSWEKCWDPRGKLRNLDGKSEQSSHSPGSSHQRPYHFQRKKEKKMDKYRDCSAICGWFLSHSAFCHTWCLYLLHKSKLSSCQDIFDWTCQLALHRSERWKKKRFEKEGKINIGILIFLHNVLGHPQDLHKIWRPWLHKVTEILVREKEKWINKGTDKHYMVDSL